MVLFRVEAGNIPQRCQELEEAAREALGKDDLHAVILQASRNIIPAPFAAALAFARCFAPDGIDEIIHDVRDRKYETPRTTLNTMIKKLEEKGQARPKCLQMMNGVKALLCGNQTLTRLESTNKGYEWMKENRIKVGMSPTIVPAWYKR